MSDDLIKYFFGGFVRLHILYHAAKAPICGVDMMEELGRHGYELSPGTLYPILHQLEKRGYLICEKQVVGGRQRKNYSITRDGRKLLRGARAKLQELAGEVIEDRDSMVRAKRKQKDKKKG